MDRLTALPTPKTRATWRSVKGWFQQLVRFIPHGHEIQELLAAAEQSGEDEDWQRFLQRLEQHTIKCTHALEGDAFGVTVDASHAGWGSCLLQHNNIVCCASGLWAQSLRHQMSNHLEMEALVKALKTFRPWTFGAQVTVFSDNASVVSAENSDNHSDFIKRRLDQLQEFCPRIQFIEGKTNVLSDLLSRQSLLFAGDRPPNRREQLNSIQASEDVEDEGLLLAHQGHLGINQTFAMAKELGLPVTRPQVEAFVRRCRACQQFLPRRPSGPLGHLPDPTRPGELLAMDFIGPLRRAPTGVRYIFTIIDALSRFGFAVPFKCSDMKSAQRGIQKWIDEYGRPERILCDRASYFQSSKFQQWAAEHGFVVVLTAPHAHHSNGLLERYNQSLIGRIRRMLASGKRRNWKEVLPEAVLVLNRVPHTVTGFSPQRLMLGRDVRDGTVPEDVLNQERKTAGERTVQSREKLLKDWEDKPKFQPEPGDLVWLYDAVRMARLDAKFEPFWTGPYEVIELRSPHIYLVKERKTQKTSVVHVDNLQPYY